MPYPASAIANYMLDLAQAKGEHLTQISLQKLVYFSHGWHLGYNNEPLIEEPIEAWPYGPVVRKLYDAFKRFGSKSIDGRAKDYQMDPRNHLHTITPALESTDTYTREFVDGIFDQYALLEPFELVELTHAEGSPWAKARSRGSNVIPNPEIRDYFSRMALISL